jgi:DNA repair protein RadC
MNYSEINKLSKKELVALLVKEQFGAITGGDKANKFLTTFAGLIKDWSKENVCVVCLNVKNEVVHAEVVSTGSVSSSIVHPREIFKPAIVNSATSILIGHNHPSNNPDPSPQDNQVTQIIKDAGNILSIPLLDHIVFTKVGDYYSYSEKGKL